MNPLKHCMMGLTGKVALVTGGAQGLGEAFTRTLLKQGVKVAMIDVQAQLGEQTLKKLQADFGTDNVAFYKASVTSQEEFEAAFASTKTKFGGLDIVVNNAGVGGEAPDTWERTVDINVKGTMRGTLLAMDNMRKDKGGRGGVIVNVASLAGLNPNPCAPTYGATKSAVICYSRCWAMNPEIAANGVRINVLAPAFVDTQMTRTLKEPGKSFMPGVADQILNRAGVMTVDHVADHMLELLDEELNKNGQVMTLAQTTGKAYHTL